jgi:hypothetical protein
MNDYFSSCVFLLFEHLHSKDEAQGPTEVGLKQVGLGLLKRIRNYKIAWLAIKFLP